MTDTLKHVTKYGSRKFLITGVALFVATAFCGFKVITGAEWTNITLACVAAYNLGNALAAR